MATTCLFNGNADMYGLGIRIGYYLQWFGLLIAAWVCPKEVQTLRLTHTFFVAATFLAILTQVPKAGLDVVEIYIILLFTFGSSLSLLPVLLWRIAVRCRARWDPSRFPKARPPGKFYNIMQSLLLSAVLSFQLWFWIYKVRDLEKRNCRQYGFLYKRVPLDGRIMRIFNLVFCSLLLTLIVSFLIMTIIPRYAGKVLKVKDEDLSGINKSLVRGFHIYETATRIFVAATIITATELTIRWNNILGINAINTAGQTIPLVLGIGSFLRVLYIGATQFKDPDESDESDISKEVTAWNHIPGRASIPEVSYVPTAWNDIPPKPGYQAASHLTEPVPWHELPQSYGQAASDVGEPVPWHHVPQNYAEMPTSPNARK